MNGQTDLRAVSLTQSARLQDFHLQGSKHTKWSSRVLEPMTTLQMCELLQLAEATLCEISTRHPSSAASITTDQAPLTTA